MKATLSLLKNNGFVLLSTLIVMSVVFSLFGSLSSLRLYQKLQHHHLTLAKESIQIELDGLNCLLNHDCPFGYRYRQYHSSIQIIINEDDFQIEVVGRHNFKVCGRLDVENGWLIQYTYSAK